MSPSFRIPALLVLGLGVAALGAADRPGPLPEPTLDDPTIVAIFDVANTADIETGELAWNQGASKEVRAVGKRLAEDHTMVRQLGRDLAKKLGVTPTPPEPNPYLAGHQAAMAKLKQLSGKEFDRALLNHEIAFHTAVLEAISTTLLPATKNQELKALVEEVVPHFQSHRELARATKVQLGL